MREAVADLLIRYRGTILCLQGTNHTIFRRDQVKGRHVTIKNATYAEELYELIESEVGSLTIIEHDGSLYDSHADLVIPVCQACKKRALMFGTVLLIAPRYDVWIKRMKPLAHNLIIHDTMHQDSESTKEGVAPTGQMVLTGW